ncbi:MAG TPA: coagulation factor 5/8 type domain-containing protein [Thermoanaerobaculia bacterium]|nr:coagulation factor 5/8 type domain-containing protein [Thermoanaerobaculia bacterium]
MNIWSAAAMLPLWVALQSGGMAVALQNWTSHPSDAVTMNLSRDGEALRIDFDFHGHAGYAIARKSVDLELPPNYQFVFRVRGETPPQNLEFKLIDASGDNVWWLNRRDFVFPREWTTLKTKKRQIGFAWGPRGGGEIQHVASMEIVVTAGSGGKGTVWIDDVRLEPLPVIDDKPLRFTTSEIDLGETREIGGLEVIGPREFTAIVDGVAHRSTSRFLWLPDAEARNLRIEGDGVREVIVQPPTWAPTINDFYAIVAKDAPRGAYPRYFRGEQTYWTVIGAEDSEAEALIGEDGNVEPYKAGWSLEPFLEIGGKTITWADATITQSLLDGDLPIPTVTWKHKDVTLTMTAAVSESSMLMLRYRVKGSATLRLAFRKFQVNPSTQFLNTVGGVSKLEPPSDTLIYPNAKEVNLTFPLRDHATAQPIALIAERWRAKLDKTAIVIPGAPEIADTIRTNIAYTLIHRDGPSLQPGSRSYERAWIRDGALISSGLLRLGYIDEAKAFAEWFAPFQFDDGKVPCCVDHRGADPVPENDSHGELIFLVAEIWRTTGDLAFVRKLWPHVDRAARYIEQLRAQNHGEFEGLVTESISHEGYSAKPVHSYWDDFFALKGMTDAVTLAHALGLEDRRRELAAQAADFRNDLGASIRLVIDRQHLDYVPASVELADLDPSATAIGVSPLGLLSLLPERELQRTFEHYFASIAKPRDAYTPYEMRIIGALIRAGDRKRALQLVDRFMADRRPAAWNEWAEVVGTEYRKPRFIGDMPHAWIASDFIRSILDAFAYDREDGALVIGAGVPQRWIGNGTLHVGPLRTYSGTIDVRMHREGERVVVDLAGTAKARPILVRSPFDDGREEIVRGLPARVTF